MLTRGNITGWTQWNVFAELLRGVTSRPCSQADCLHRMPEMVLSKNRPENYLQKVISKSYQHFTFLILHVQCLYV